MRCLRCWYGVCGVPIARSFVFLGMPVDLSPFVIVIGIVLHGMFVSDFLERS